MKGEATVKGFPVIRLGEWRSGTDSSNTCCEMFDVCV